MPFFTSRANWKKGSCFVTCCYTILRTQKEQLYHPLYGHYIYPFIGRGVFSRPIHSRRSQFKFLTSQVSQSEYFISQVILRAMRYTLIRKSYNNVHPPATMNFLHFLARTEGNYNIWILSDMQTFSYPLHSRHNFGSATGQSVG